MLMKLIVFGATGSVGTQIVIQALECGHSVTAFTRNPEKLSSLSQPGLKILKGDICNSNAVENAIRQQDSVLCAIGDGNKGLVRAEGTRNIISAMKSTGVTRLICQTTLGLGESRGNLSFFWKHIMFGLLLKKAFKDHELQEQHLLRSGLDYTIVRPGAFIDGNITRNYSVGFDGNYKSLNLKIARADVADFMLKQLESSEYLRKAVSISN
jgi:putative NADH-flavin reductase